MEDDESETEEIDVQLPSFPVDFKYRKAKLFLLSGLTVIALLAFFTFFGAFEVEDQVEHSLMGFSIICKN